RGPGAVPGAHPPDREQGEGEAAPQPPGPGPAGLPELSASCERCGGAGFLVVGKDARDYAEPRPRPQAGPRPPARPPACRIPPRYEHCTLATFEPGEPSLRAALEKSINYCSNYPYLGSADEGLGLLFSGDNGVGKTHLAVAVLRELVASKGVRGQFWDF